MRLRRLFILLLLATVTSFPAVAHAQDDDENDPARAAALVRDAVKARGGDLYLGVRSVVTVGSIRGSTRECLATPPLRRLLVPRARTH